MFNAVNLVSSMVAQQSFGEQDLQLLRDSNYGYSEPATKPNMAVSRRYLNLSKHQDDDEAIEQSYSSSARSLKELPTKGLSSAS